ncbi:gamma-glutamyltranspeptidase [Citrobacter koseri]|uniref:Gamma-glutamyltranspeptidase n=1 Tax=Citrobacter koseri TaxID=545 RepID=A0A2X2W8Z7_CITKO|nr:gamma-glutamyltranspeptidase [Citrobacter koseri]
MPIGRSISATRILWKVPWQALTSKAYAKSIADQIDINKAKPSSEIRPGKLAPYESNQTTHFLGGG